ncbi:hypothetical protein HPB51_026851 [Rhipicephalus microplus]|uniref:Reverse transcriptase domain-containing protein n=1 Tax=Rhipicephalus microplus TaxID=6941 RepID=A0A9J6D2D3_RHIMP|nr:hypothetical protein HPB51_026851 [Rhipicephalus microplus]
MLKHHTIGQERKDVRAILEYDFEKAFNSVSHSLMLASIYSLNLGANFHKFTSPFLGNTKATLQLGDLKSKPYDLCFFGTTQGSVLSMLLFTIAMCGLTTSVSSQEGIKFAIYVGDITKLSFGGSECFMEGSLQEAVDYVEVYIKKIGLKLL